MTVARKGWRWCIGLSLIVWIGGCSSDGSNEGTAFDLRKHVRLVGRMDWSDPQAPIWSWPGSSATVRFEGSGIDLLMDVAERRDTWVDLIVDGGEPRKLHIDGSSGGVYEAARGLSAGEHTLEVYKRTEAMFGTVRFRGFALPDGGKFLAAPPRAERAIELIGDSISAGSGNEGKNGDPSIAEHENNFLAYGSVAARRLNAELHTIAVSGIGIVANYGNDRVNTMPAQYARANALHDEPKWDVRSRVPDAIVINLGTNDNGNAIEEEEFLDKYGEFAASLRESYPDAHIFLSVGPFNVLPTKERVLTLFGRLRQAGDDKIHYLMYEPANTARDGLGETGHPTVATHARMADDLVRQLQETMGW